MSRFFRSIWDNTYGLFVDDGQLAVGVVASLAIVWVLATYTTDTVRDSVGWVLIGLIMLLVLTNLYRTGLSARRRRAA